MNEHLQRIVEIICLVYHEARNIRHPIKVGKLERLPVYDALVNLPTNRDDAWIQMEKHRERAALSGSTKGAAGAFAQAFGLTLEELHELYRGDFWRDSAYGGNRWAPISQRVKELVEVADAAEDACVAAMIEEILCMCHNTGKVGDKLRQLSSPEGKR
ncbi:MAG: hypothetical protein GTO22_16635 [Gemmatimonadales bacterium]|nr:hypothetical protein [Gemmatimonadales bacterium]